MMTPLNKYLLAGAAFLLLAAFSTDGPMTVFLPGTQPNVVQSFENPSTNCQVCHQSSGSGNPVTITQDWKGSPMSLSAKDPLFYAATAVANKYVAGVGEFCIRCHSPSGWLEGRSNPPTGEGLTGNDLNGVHCDVCHRMTDPMAPDTSIDPPVPGYGNGMMTMQVARNPKRGPFSDASAFHGTLGDTLYRKGEMCGVCHDVSNPLQASNPVTQPPHTYSPIERTYSEWRLSWYADQGPDGACQSCHMVREPGYGATQGPFRPGIPRHDLTGGNTFLPDILPDFWSFGADTARLAQGKARALATLRSSASLGLSATRHGDSTRVRIVVTNLTGHKLPTGYPEGRRMWLAIVGVNSVGDTVFRSGHYDAASGDLTLDAQVKVYECKPGLTAAQAHRYGLQPGPSFHFVLNDTIFKDNRIPPRGFSNAAFASRRAEPVGYPYQDGQYSDTTWYRLPATTSTVIATLLYQTASKEYITFLRDENRGNPADWRHWGDSLYASWDRRGKSMPAVIQSQTALVTGGPGLDAVEGRPLSISLLQNFPNPFNPGTEIRWTMDRASDVRVSVYDLTGRRMATLAEGRFGPGNHAIRWNAAAVPSGIYFCELVADNGRIREAVRMILYK